MRAFATASLLRIFLPLILVCLCCPLFLVCLLFYVSLLFPQTRISCVALPLSVCVIRRESKKETDRKTRSNNSHIEETGKGREETLIHTQRKRRKCKNTSNESARRLRYRAEYINRQSRFNYQLNAPPNDTEISNDPRKSFSVTMCSSAENDAEEE